MGAAVVLCLIGSVDAPARGSTPNDDSAAAAPATDVGVPAVAPAKVEKAPAQSPPPANDKSGEDEETDEDEDVVIDDGEASPGVKTAPTGGDDDVVFVDDPDAAEPPVSDGGTPGFEKSSTARTMFTGSFDTRAMLDLAWEGGGEDVFALKNRFALKLEYEPNPFMRVVVGGYFIHRLMVDDEPDSDSQVRSTIDPQLGEAYVLWRFDIGLDLAIGHRVITWGRTDFTRPLNVLNPVDKRDGPLPTSYSRQLPVWSVEAAQRIGPISVSLVWIPWFRPNAVDWIGTDWAILQPELQTLMPQSLRAAFTAVSPSRYDDIQEVFESTEDPPDDGLTGADVGLRLTTTVAGVDLGLAYAFQWDRTPVINYDSDAFAAALKATLDGNPASAAAVRDAYSSRYERRHVVGADFNFTLGPVGIKGDVAFSSEQTFYTEDLASIRKPSLNWALQLDFMYEFIFDASLELSHLVVFGLGDGVSLAVVDDDMVTLTGVVNMRLGLELMVSVLTQWVVSHGDVMLSPRFMWRLSGLASLEVGVGIFMPGEEGLVTRTPAALSRNADYVYLNSTLSF